MQIETSAGSPVPSLTRRNKEQNLLSASLSKDLLGKSNVEKTLYRSVKHPDSKETDNFARAASAYNPNTEYSRSRLNKRKSNDKANVDWNDLGEKIEDWFEYAKTPDQKIVYRFLRDIKDEDYDRDIASVLSNETNVADKAQSLEDILDNLKKYRHKFNRKTNQSRSKTAVNQSLNGANNGLPNLSKTNNLLSNSTDQLNTMFESSTWRVMRHLKSADIRNKYPLPKANPDYHFRNATIFQTAGRPPKSTFLLHPDWV